MGWINWVSLGSGLGIGTILGWWLGRSRPSPANSVSQSIQPERLQADPVQPEQPQPEQLQREQQLKHLQTQLAYLVAKETAQFKAGFLARTSHELRSPINSVISLHQLILSDLCENQEEEREFVAQASTAAQKMLTLLDYLIKVSKADYGTEGLKVRSVCLEDVLMETQQFVLLQAKNRNLRLDLVYPEPDVEVLADWDWLRQVLLNLIDTPISQMQEGTVRVTTQVNSQDKEVYIDIEDERPVEFWSDAIDLLNDLKIEPILSHADGSVIDRNKVEERMQALDMLPSPGLMLLVNQTILELMGGRLELRSIPSAQITTPEEQLTRIRCVVLQA